MTKFKALLFDLDGTLIDSEHFHYRVWNEILAESAVQLQYSDFLKNFAGVPLPGNAKRLKELYEIESPLEALILQKEELTNERLKTSTIELMPYVEETLDFFFSKGIAMALVTASKRTDVDEVFRKNGLNKYFNLLVTRSDVTKSKPDPESYNLAVQGIGFQKSECLVFEDTVNGLMAAKNAELTCFAIQGDEESHAKLASADQIFTDFRAAQAYIIANELI
ncbi:HAD family phosphatase [Pedobacter sp. PAMC26386]|nr:HAD family phosphatase [Pedobacter sp. PAMC26386]